MRTTGRRYLLVSALAAGAVMVTTGGAAAGQAAAPALQFRAQEIAKDFGVGYAVVPGDVNGDGVTDILAISGTELVWFQAPTWEKNVILGAGATTADNVTLAPHDIDGDGRLDIALGAGWTRQNTGTLQWVRQNAPGATPAWEVFQISAEPTLHRIRWADVDGDKKLELIVAPLHGKGAKGPDWDGPSARLLVFRPPANPRTDPWPMEVASEANHIQHNFLSMNFDKDPQEEIVTASKEGLMLHKRAKDGTWTRTLIGEGAPGEVKLGRVGGRRVLATVEPWHGAGIAVYTEQPGAWAKTTIETALTEGHALGWADFDGDGNEELAAGWRRGTAPGIAIYIVDRDGALKSKVKVDEGGMDTEDLIVGDFNGDKQPDIVASGRATRNIKIYWNETKGKGKPSAGNEWRRLFNGRDLSGFTTTGTATWKVEDGIIVGGQDGDFRKRGTLITTDEFKDFELELDFLIDEHGKYNSGIQIRGTGYQVNIGRPPAGEFIGVGVHRGEPRQFVWLSKGDERDTVRKPLQWNTLRVLAQGAHFEVTLNGVKTVDVTDPAPDPRWLEKGPLRFQTYGAEDHAGFVKFRNLKIREL